MRRGVLTCTVTSLLLKPLLQRLIDVTSFWNSKMLYSQPVLFKHTNNRCFVFPNCLDHRIYKSKFLTHISNLVSIFYCLYKFNFFFFDIQNTFFCLWRYSSVNGRSTKEHQAQLPLLLSVFQPGIYIPTWKSTGLALSRIQIWLNSQNSLCLGNYIRTDDWQCHIWGRVSYVFCTKQGRKHVPYEKSVGTTECIIFMFLWPCIVSKAWRKNTNKMQQYRWFIVNSDVDYWLQSRHVSGIFMPIIRRKNHVLLRMGYICW